MSSLLWSYLHCTTSLLSLNLWGFLLKGRSFFLLEWLSYKASVVLCREDDGCESKRPWGLFQKSVTISQNQFMKWTTWVSCAYGRCLAKILLKAISCFYRSRKRQYLDSLAREGLLTPFLPWGGAGRSGSVLVQLESWVLLKIWAGFGLLRGAACTSPCAPAWICCKWWEDWTNKPSTHLLVSVPPHSAETSKEAQTGSGAVDDTKRGRLCARGSLFTLKKVALHYLAWRNARKNRSWSLKESVVFNI